ncbi:MAG: aldo/keto reductase [Clostridia bacterium]|nr:aldo/keto reductase [Clostridia bacterium]
MKYGKINHTDLTASRVILGTDRFGSAISTEESFAILDHFLAAGGNILDTASVYANWLPGEKSLSEKTIGKWLSARNNRDKVIVSTKGGHFDLDTGAPRLDFDSVKSDYENSLLNLKTDYVDIYWLHKDDTERSPEELIETVNRVTEGGGAHYLAVSNWSYDRIRAANDHAAKCGLRPFIASQIQHSIAKVNAVAEGITVLTEEEYAKYETDNLNVFGFSSQAKGFFAIIAEKGEGALPAATRAEFYNQTNLARLDRVKALAEEKGASVPAIVLATLFADDKVNTFAQIGPQSVAELDMSLSAVAVTVTAEERRKLLFGEE